MPTYSKNWQRDTAHSAADVSRVWQNALENVFCDVQQVIHGTEVEEFMPLRIDCDCNVWITCCDGTEKQILTSQQVKDLLQGQPGSGAPQPGPGHCQSYNLKLQAAFQALVPTIVNAGDVITFTSISGAGSDGTAAWFCPNGLAFFAGACGGSGSTSGSDPAPAINHMTVLAKIGAVYYDATAGPITVPGGIVNGQVTMLVNDVTPADNSGEYSITVEVCNNTSATFVHTFDLLTSDGGWVRNNPTDLNNTWALGIGWQDALHTSGTIRGVQLKRDFASTVLTSLELHYTMSGKDATATTDGEVSLPAFVLFFQQPGQNGTDITVGGGTTTSATRLIFSAFSSYGGGNVGSTIITKIIVRGNGTDPF